jgi:hypothetical protein
MASQIGWIDFSPRHRDRVRKFMDLMGMGGIVDELGVGVIRDAISNKVFPGFSTLYTRAKYFFITPYILEDRDNIAKQDKDYFKKAERESNEIIIRYYKAHPERGDESYFGKVKQDGTLKRQPSEIYWNGMTLFHLIKTENSLDQMLLNKRSTVEELLSNNRGDDTTKELGEYKNYGYDGVSYSPDWRQYIQNNGLSLSRIEAEILRDRLLKYTPDSLPAALVSSKSLWEKYLFASEGFDTDDPLCNQFLYFIRTGLTEISNHPLRENLIMSHDLSLFLYGIHIAYNLWLRIKTGAQDKDILSLREQGRMWYSRLFNQMLDSDSFDIRKCMNGTNVKPPTEKFLKEVQTLLRSSDSWDDIEVSLCNLVEAQERWNKKAKSRFVKIDKGQVIDGINDRQWVGLGLINYRYASTLSVMRDLNVGLNNID